MRKNLFLQEKKLLKFAVLKKLERNVKNQREKNKIYMIEKD